MAEPGRDCVKSGCNKEQIMKHCDYRTKGTCAVQIHFDIDDDKKIRNVSFDGGCNGNLKAISKLVEGKDAGEIADLLYGNTCGMKNTSCADQLSIALEKAVADQDSAE